jgi:hypothetical protein
MAAAGFRPGAFLVQNAGQTPCDKKRSVLDAQIPGKEPKVTIEGDRPVQQWLGLET